MASQSFATRGTAARHALAVLVGLMAGMVALTGCGTSSEAAARNTVDLVGFSILEQPNKDVFADFEKTPAGRNATFKTSYGASGDQSRAVESGLPHPATNPRVLPGAGSRGAAPCPRV